MGPSVGTCLHAILITLAVAITPLGGCSTDDPPEAAGTSTSLAPVAPSLRSPPVDLRRLYNLPPLRNGADDEAGRLSAWASERARRTRHGRPQPTP